MLDKELLKYIKEKKWYLINNVILNIIGLILNLGITSSLIYIIYNIINNAINKILITSLILLICLIIKFVITFIANKIINKLADYVILKLRNETYAKYLKLNGNIFSVNEMAQLSVEGIEQLRLYYLAYLPSFFYAMIAPLLLFIVFVFIDYKVALVYLLCIPLIPLSIILVSKWAKKIFNKYWDIYLGLGDTFLDNVKGMRELQIFNFTAEREKEIASSNEEFRKITMKVLVMQLYSTSIMDLVAYGGAAIGIVIALNDLFNGTAWYLVLFMILVGAEFFLPLRKLGSAFHVAMNGATAGKKVMKLLNQEVKGRKLELVENIREIKIDKLSFSYADKIILKEINMQFNKGLYAIVGVSGSGKSTLAKIMANVNANYSGTVLANGLEIKDIKLTKYYQKVAYIANNTHIMHKTINESFTFYNSNITEEKIWELLKLVEMDDIINRNGGLNFIINDSASNISGGEKQRLIIAFYLANSYDLYIFDEATSNIDKESEKIILDIIKNLAKDKIVINITHRLKNVIDSDYIYYLENKKIYEEGKPFDLIKENTKFKQIYNYQSALEEVK